MYPLARARGCEGGAGGESASQNSRRGVERRSPRVVRSRAARARANGGRGEDTRVPRIGEFAARFRIGRAIPTRASRGEARRDALAAARTSIRRASDRKHASVGRAPPRSALRPAGVKVHDFDVDRRRGARRSGSDERPARMDASRALVEGARGSLAPATGRAPKLTPKSEPYQICYSFITAIIV